MLEAKLSGHVAEAIEQSALRTYPCPICGRDDALQSLTSVVAQGVASLESSFCTRCYHRFHRRFPRADWLQDYYQRKFQSVPELLPRIATSGVARASQRVRRALGEARRRLRGVTLGHRVFDFCEGVLTGSVGYYQRDQSIRKVLEIGCGYGEQLLLFRAKGFRAFGTESSPVRVAACRARGLDVRLCDIEGFEPVETLAPFDFIYSTHVLEHVIDIDSHVRRLAAMLRDGGYLFLETPHLSGESLVYQAHTVYHVQTFSLRSMQKLLARHGLAPLRLAADNNIRLLAKKAPLPHIEQTFFGAASQPLSLQAFPYVQAMADAAPGEFTLRWDHYYVEVDGANGETLYRGGLGGLHVARGPHRHEIRVRVPEAPGDSDVLPVVFDHVGAERPPVWYKL
jgi:SAM-dependent methyltransferase